MDVPRWMGYALMFLLAVEFFSHLGYTVGNRTASIERADFHQAKLVKPVEDMSVDHAASLKTFRERHATLVAERAAAVKANPWAVQITPEALQSDLETAKFAVEREASNGGCKSICENKKREVGRIEKQIGQISALSASAVEINALEKKIDGTEKAMKTSAEKVAELGYKESPIKNQTKFAAQLVTWELEPDQQAMSWTMIVIGAMIALVTTAISPLAAKLLFADWSNSGTAGGSSESAGTRPKREPLPVIRGGNHGDRDGIAAESMFQTMPAMMAASLPGSTETNSTINVIDGGGALAHQIAELCKMHTMKLNPAI